MSDDATSLPEASDAVVIGAGPGGLAAAAELRRVGVHALVLDDPLSALDVDTEALVEAALRTVLATTTALMVAHRPSTVMLADRVALLEAGRVSAVGTHSELLASNEHYRFVISSLEDELERERKEAVR